MKFFQIHKEKNILNSNVFINSRMQIWFHPQITHFHLHYMSLHILHFFLLPLSVPASFWYACFFHMKSHNDQHAAHVCVSACVYECVDQWVKPSTWINPGRKRDSFPLPAWDPWATHPVSTATDRIMPLLNWINKQIIYFPSRCLRGKTRFRYLKLPAESSST